MCFSFLIEFFCDITPQRDGWMIYLLLLGKLFLSFLIAFPLAGERRFRKSQANVVLAFLLPPNSWGLISAWRSEAWCSKDMPAQSAYFF